MLYSIIYHAQQVHFPSDPMQPGPMYMYFLCPRKCGLFGVTCEGMPQQVTYLIDEGMSISKGVNSVSSFLDHFFANHGLGEKYVHLHCDNCSGQNKNNYLLWYLAWRVMHSLHLSVSLNCLITGHTKFGPDWCFGQIKQNYRRHMVSCLEDIGDVIKTSTVTGVNIPQKVGSEDGEVEVPQADWQSFLRPFFRLMKGIKQYHHFRFDAAQSGVVYRREYSDSEEERCELLLDSEVLPPQHRPQPVTPPGFDNNRKWYPHNKIREFCTPNTMDIVLGQQKSPSVCHDQWCNQVLGMLARVVVAGEVAEEVVGDVLGEMTGKMAGEKAGEMTGKMAGEKAGMCEVAGEMVGEMTGKMAGTMAGEMTGELAGDKAGETSQTTGELAGDVTGEVTGELAGDKAGKMAGEVTGDKAGKMAGELAGEVTGELAGEKAGETTGETTGEKAGKMAGELSGEVVDKLVNPPPNVDVGGRGVNSQ